MADFRQAETGADRSLCLGLRWEVFVEEQGVAAEEEQDGKDALCTHFLGEEAGVPIAAARVLFTEDGAKFQRVCVVKSARGTGAGAGLMRYIMDWVRADARTDRVYLGSQTHAMAFYEGLGFRAYGPEYLDAGIPHRDMERTV